MQDEIELAEAIIRQSYTGSDSEAARKLAYAILRAEAKVVLLESQLKALRGPIDKLPSPLAQSS